MNTTIAFRRRLGSSHRILTCHNTVGCPDIFELTDGDFAVIGSDITNEAGKLPADAGCAPHERIIRIPRSLLVHAKRDIPEK